MRHQEHTHGMRRHVTVSCDEERGRTWDIWRHGRCVEQGFSTRRAARSRCAQLDIDEAQASSRNNDGTNDKG